MSAPIILIGPDCSEDAVLSDAGLRGIRFHSLDDWWENQPGCPMAFVVDACQNTPGLDGFQISRILKRCPGYHTIPVVIRDNQAVCPSHHYVSRVDAICQSMPEVVAQLKTVTAMFQQVANPPQTPIPFSKMAVNWDSHIVLHQLQDDLHQLSALLPDVTSAVHMALSLFEEVLDYQVAGILLCSPHTLIPSLLYLSPPHGDPALSALTQQHLTYCLTEALPFKLPDAPRVEAFGGTASDEPLQHFAHQLVLPFHKGNQPYGAVVFWANTPIPRHLVIQTIELWLTNWFRQVAWVRQLAHGELLDGLTQTYQYTYLMRQLQSEVQRAKRYEHPICVMKIFVHDMDVVNQQFGFDAGDRVLKTVAELIQDSVRQPDIVGRYRTNEFMVLMPETTIVDAQQASQRLMDKVAHTILHLNQQSFTPIVRIGISCLQDGDGTADDLIRSVHTLAIAANTEQPVNSKVLILKSS